MSEGNGHPYSWSAIFNGYNAEFMKECPYPVIPEYLSLQNYPQNFLSKIGRVTHVWTQDLEVSNHIAKSSCIENVSLSIQDMLLDVDAVLLARDDSENHLTFLEILLESGKPIFVDKPFALTTNDAKTMWAKQKYENQIFTCSSLRYSKELLLTDDEKSMIGDIKGFEASIMSNWSTYAIHLIEPIIIQIPQRGELLRVLPIKDNECQRTLIVWENIAGYIKNTGKVSCPIEIKFIGNKANVTKIFYDSFNCFKASLKHFVDLIDGHTVNIDKNETLEIVKILELGNI